MADQQAVRKTRVTVHIYSGETNTSIFVHTRNEAGVKSAVVHSAPDAVAEATRSIIKALC